MVEMTREERKVANFLTEKKFIWKFQPSVSVIDDGNRTRLFNPDFYLTDLNIYIEVCGAERTEHYERTREIYKKNNVPIIYVETYKDEDKWKYFLLQSIKEIQDKRQSAVSTIETYKPVFNEFAEKPLVVNQPVIRTEGKKAYLKTDIVSKQSQIGVILTFLGLLFIALSFIAVFYNAIVTILLLIIGFIVFFRYFRYL